MIKIPSLKSERIYNIISSIILIIISFGILFPVNYLPYYIILLIILLINSYFRHKNIFVAEGGGNPLISDFVTTTTGVHLNRDQYENITNWVLFGLIIIAFIRYTRFVKGILVINNKIKIAF